MPSDAQTKLILASSSSYRKALLQKLHIPFSCQSPDIDETPLAGETAEQLVQRLSIKKARTIAELSDFPCLVIGSDQVATLDDLILTKPLNHHNATLQLQRCSGRTVRFITGLCLYNKQTQCFQYATEVFDVFFRELSTEHIEQYLNIDKPYDCAGSFKAEGLGINLFTRMQGDDPNSLIGLPLIRLVDFLLAENFPLFSKQ